MPLCCIEKITSYHLAHVYSLFICVGLNKQKREQLVWQQKFLKIPVVVSHIWRKDCTPNVSWAQNINGKFLLKTSLQLHLLAGGNTFFSLTW